MKVNSYICNKKFEHDAEVFSFNDIISYLRDCKSNIKIWVLGNVNVGNNQIDILIIKENCLLCIDMKNYTGRIIGTENGEWYVESESGVEIDIGKNCFKQAQKQRYALVDELGSVISRGGLLNFRDNPRVFTNSKAWMYFNEGSTYDHHQIPSTTLNWFKVVTMDELCKEVINADSNTYRLTEDDINELLNVFQAEPIDKEQDNRRKIDAAWLKIKDEPEEAKKIFERVLGVSHEEDLKIICKHGIALAQKSHNERLKALLKLREEYEEYSGFKEHDIFMDLFEAYWLADTPLNDTDHEKIRSIYENLKKSDQIDLIYRIFMASYFERGLDYTNFPLQREMAILLSTYYPDKLELLDRVYYTILRDEESDFGEEEQIGTLKMRRYTLSHDDYTERKRATTPILKKLLEKSDNPEEHILNYIYGDYPEVGFSENEFIEILTARIKKESSNASTYYFYLGEYYWNGLFEKRDEWSGEELEIELANKIEHCYLEGLKIDKNDRRCLHQLVRWYFVFNPLDKAKEYGNSLIDLEDSEVQDFELVAEVLTSIVHKQKDEERDWSGVISVLEKGINKFPESGELKSKLGVISDEMGLRDKAVEYFKKTLENPKHKLSGVIDIRTGEAVERMLSDYEIVAVKSLLDIYLKRRNYYEAFELAEKLRKMPVSHYEKYTAHAYVAFADWLKERYKLPEEEEKEKGEREEKLDVKKYSLQHFAMSPELKEELGYIIYKLKETKKPDSLLLYGPPGTGKTELARTIAGELSFEFLELDATILSKWSGETENNIKEFFEKAREDGNYVIIIDEFESLGYTREQLTQSHEFLRTGELLRQIEKTMKSDKNILIIACTNYKEILDKALIRKGRFNHHIELPYPTLDVRREIFKIKLEELVDVEQKELFNYDKFAKETERLTGAEIHYIVSKLIPRVIFEHGEEDVINDKIVLEAIEKFKNEMKAEDTTGFSGVPYHQ